MGRGAAPTLLFLLSLTLAPAVIWAQERPAPQVLVFVVNQGGDGPSPFHGFVSTNVQLELRRAGLRAAIAADLGIDVSGVDPTDPVSVAAPARAARTPAAVTAAFVVTVGRIAISLRAYDCVSPEALVSADREAPVDLALDTAIGEAMRQIVPAVKALLARYPEGMPAGIAGAGAPTAGGGRSDQVASDAVRETASGSAVPGAALPESGTVEPLRGGALAVSVGVGPFLTAGSFGAFIGAGLSPIIAIDYEFSSRVAAGLLLGATGFLASGPLSEAQGVLAHAGVDFRYLRDFSPTYGMYFRAGGGPALFVITTEATGGLMKLVPFATAGLGITRLLNRRTGLSFDAAYQAFLESGELLHGVIPSVNLLKRF